VATSLQSPVVLDADDLKQLGVNFLTDNLPGFAPTTGDFTDAVLTAVAQMMSYGLAQYGDPTTAMIRYAAPILFRTSPFSAVSATATSTWVTDGTTGTIPAGTYVTVQDASGAPVEFQVATSTVVTSPATTTTGVPLVAAEAGVAGNGLTGAAQIIDRVAFAVSCTLTTTSAGGVDDESDVDYVGRVTQLSPLIALRLILPGDFALAARLLVPGVARAGAIDQYEASTSTAGVARAVTVVVADSTGGNLSTPIKNQVAAIFAADRETTFESFVIDPTRTAITVAFAAVAYTGYDPTSVQAAAIQALTDFLSPALWGVPPNGDTSQWRDRPKVYFQDVVTALNNVDGLDHYTSLTVNGGTADVTLAGPGFGLPTPSVSGVVT
jgi:hypothetical protein